MVWPGLAVLLTTLAFNLLGDGLRDAFDPRSASSANPQAQPASRTSSTQLHPALTNARQRRLMC